MPLSRSLITSAVVLLWLAVPASAQRPPEDRRNESATPSFRGSGGGFTVQVVSPPGEKALPAMVVVEMHNLSGGNTRIQWAQGDGTARFDDVPGGSYTFRVVAEEYQDAKTAETARAKLAQRR